MVPSASRRILLLAALALTASLGRAQTNSTLPVCAESCAVVVAVEAGCNVEDDSCCTNSVFISYVETCVDYDCTTAEQQEASSYFDSACGVSSSSGASSGTLSFGSSGSIAATATTTKTTAAAAASTTSSSGSGLSGFNGSSGSFATPTDLMKIFVSVVMGVAAMTQL
ncbi:hypothetical protein J3R30DRAFT_3736153 [Lentinula aciculospora]|uniref:CFEM domain-containing protein n=1 Tax=Lentinula aciculospora TaxID=153920 RepID=A0A9W9A3X3_9AGAR|nr:hypothetical protein J3R30DRAFT_3736153 [Lentinula aciculospora]